MKNTFCVLLRCGNFPIFTDLFIAVEFTTYGKALGQVFSPAMNKSVKTETFHSRRKTQDVFFIIFGEEHAHHPQHPLIVRPDTIPMLYVDREIIIISRDAVFDERSNMKEAAPGSRKQHTIEKVTVSRTSHKQFQKWNLQTQSLLSLSLLTSRRWKFSWHFLLFFN